MALEERDLEEVRIVLRGPAEERLRGRGVAGPDLGEREEGMSPRRPGILLDLGPQQLARGLEPPRVDALPRLGEPVVRRERRRWRRLRRGRRRLLPRLKI